MTSRSLLNLKHDDEHTPAGLNTGGKYRGAGHSCFLFCRVLRTRTCYRYKPRHYRWNIVLLDDTNLDAMWRGSMPATMGKFTINNVVTSDVAVEERALGTNLDTA